ncbi:MAG: DUF1553 domain-containing protein [Verrucomicrobiales bacterium]|jgi:hypothetical protein|nr:DUF1553 domain-containing protein [Verrucomicrobiales bacterium]
MNLVSLLPILLAATGLSVEALGGVHPIFESGPVVRPPEVSENPSDQLDRLVFARLDTLGLQAANACSDAVFLRRAYLVTIGTLPREDETRDFLASTDESKRVLLVEHLLSRPEYADYWAMKWGDVLRVKAEFPIKLWPNAVQIYHQWIQASVRDNKPFHQFAQELLVGSGSNFREGQVNFYRAMQDRSPRGMAATVALTFMGERAEKWPERKLDAMAGFFANVAFKSTAEWKEEIVYFDPTADKDGLSKNAIFPDGTPVKLDAGKSDPRVVFAAWLLRPENASFSRCAANRIWTWLMGQGIVHEPDDFRPDNPPSDPELLAFLEKEFITSRCDMKHLIRVILNSRTFALSSIPPLDTPEATVHFAHYPMRRLEAEVLIDALNQITETKEAYSSPIPEPFTFIPDDVRGIALPDGSITSPFLELFGRPPRDTGYQFERSLDTNAAQRLHFLNSSHVQKKIEASPLVANASTEEFAKLVEKTYLTILSRFPTTDELATLQSYTDSGSASGRALAVDLVWSLINQPEFLYNH